MSEPKLTDEQAMAMIHALFDAHEWDADVTAYTALIIQRTGRVIREPMLASDEEAPRVGDHVERDLY